MFLTVQAEEVNKEGGSSYITKSGIYTTTLRNCEIKGTANGATQANYFFKDAISYGNNIVGTTGQKVFGYQIISALAATLGEDSLSDPEAATVTFKSGSKELMCIPELEDREVQVWIQFAYDRYNGDIKERVNVKRFYRAGDGASGSESLTGENIGAQIAKDGKYAAEIKYADGVTAEEVERWKESQRSASSAPAANAAADAGFSGASAAATPAAGGFPGA